MREILTGIFTWRWFFEPHFLDERLPINRFPNLILDSQS